MTSRDWMAYALGVCLGLLAMMLVGGAPAGSVTARRRAAGRAAERRPLFAAVSAAPTELGARAALWLGRKRRGRGAAAWTAPPASETRSAEGRIPQDLTPSLLKYCTTEARPPRWAYRAWPAASPKVTRETPALLGAAPRPPGWGGRIPGAPRNASAAHAGPGGNEESARRQETGGRVGDALTARHPPTTAGQGGPAADPGTAPTRTRAEPPRRDQTATRQDPPCGAPEVRAAAHARHGAPCAGTVGTGPRPDVYPTTGRGTARGPTTTDQLRWERPAPLNREGRPAQRRPRRLRSRPIRRRQTTGPAATRRRSPARRRTPRPDPRDETPDGDPRTPPPPTSCADATRPTTSPTTRTDSAQRGPSATRRPPRAAARARRRRPRRRDGSPSATGPPRPAPRTAADAPADSRPARRHPPPRPRTRRRRPTTADGRPSSSAGVEPPLVRRPPRVPLCALVALRPAAGLFRRRARLAGSCVAPVPAAAPR